ncbi:MAG: TIGR00282 family metallophosphoesterase [Spirochaetota bacterium]
MGDEVKVLCVGDLIGDAGRSALRDTLPKLKEEHHIDFVVANGENAAGGFGITRDIAADIFSMGVDAITSGNHIWKCKDVFAFIGDEKRLLRPFNYPEGTPGNGYTVFDVNGRKIAVLNLLGRTFMDAVDCPFRRGLHAVKAIEKETKIIIVDFHAEATAEKQAMGYHLDGIVSAVTGTHTHVQTADERILKNGTAYITDLGMCGGENSVIGIRRDAAIKRFVTNLPHKFEVDKEDPVLHGAVITIDASSGKATAIERIRAKKP